ncbi:MAG TPA: hypothetical protein VES20_24565 [Bryobacteraceae bacterium]|nr:hypothetical protein [Bryobacteraceae bacterium]
MAESRREFLAAAAVAGLLPWNWFRRAPGIAGIRFRRVRRTGARRYIHIHGNERTAHDTLVAHLDAARGDAFFIRSDERNVTAAGLTVDPNRIWSRVGAERSLRNLNKDHSSVEKALRRIDSDRDAFLKSLLPRDGNLLIALHNNGPGYSVQDEVPISDGVALNNAAHPDEFILCTMRADFDVLSAGPYNVLLQQKPPGEDDGSLSRLCAARNVRYVNIEAAHDNAAAQRAMLDWVERTI